jgi:hypothetical protein
MRWTDCVRQAAAEQLATVVHSRLVDTDLWLWGLSHDVLEGWEREHLLSKEE